MSNTDQAPEPTMDEILASIRRIISDEPTEAKLDAAENTTPEPDDTVAGDIARALNFGGPEDASVSGMDDDILELTEVVSSTQSPDVPQFTDTGQAGGIAPDQGLASMDEFTVPPMAQEQPAPDGVNGIQGFDAPGDFNGGIQAGVGDPMMQPPQQQENAAFADQDIFGSPPSGEMLPDEQHPTNLAMSDGMSFDAPALESEPQITPDPVLIDSGGMDAVGGDPFGSVAGGIPEQDNIAVNTGGAPDIADIADQLAQEIEQSDEPIEARGWDEDESQVEEQLVEDALKERLEADGVETAMADFGDTAGQSEEVLANDENVTFGELSPEESIESALEKAIQSDELTSELADDLSSDLVSDASVDLEQAWDDNGSDEQQVEVTPEVAETSGSGADIPPEVQEEAVDNMELTRVENSSEVAGSSGMEEDLSSAVASVKETVTPDLPAEAGEKSVEAVQPMQPDVSEVVPAMSSSPTGSPFEESIKDMLKPMLKEWLDDNMPRLLEGAMKEARELENKKK